MVVGFVACQNDTHAVFSPVPSPTPHTAPTAAILQSADVPTGLNVCLGSGPMDVYLSVLRNGDPALASLLGDQWLAMMQSGATAGAISVFAANASACKSELGATTNVKAMTSIVAEFADASQADRAWEAGVF